MSDPQQEQQKKRRGRREEVGVCYSQNSQKKLLQEQLRELTTFAKRRECNQTKPTNQKQIRAGLLKTHAEPIKNGRLSSGALRLHPLLFKQSRYNDEVRYSNRMH